jgi:hypothetical protein
MYAIIIKLYLIRNQLFYLEKELDKIKEDDDSPVFDDIMVLTDRFHRVRDKAIKTYGSDKLVDGLMYLMDRCCGDA